MRWRASGSLATRRICGILVTLPIQIKLRKRWDYRWLDAVATGATGPILSPRALLFCQAIEMVLTIVLCLGTQAPVVATRVTLLLAQPRANFPRTVKRFVCEHKTQPATTYKTRCQITRFQGDMCSFKAHRSRPNSIHVGS